MSVISQVGHNNPPSDIDDAIAPFADAIEEAQNWADGTPVENEAQMRVVDGLIKEIKAAKKAVEGAEEGAAKPIYDAWKAEKARFAPTITDLDRLTKALVATVDGFKRKLAAEKAEAQRKAQMAAEEAARAARDAALRADAANIEAIRDAARLQEEAEAAQRAASAASNDTVRGLRKVTKYEVTDHRTLLHWIVKNDRDAVTDFINGWAKANHKECANADGLRVWIEKEAF